MFVLVYLVLKEVYLVKKIISIKNSTGRIVSALKSADCTCAFASRQYLAGLCLK